jgi:hypothetical protein
MAIGTDSRKRVHLGSWGWFWAWAVVGIAGAIGLVSLGLLVLVPALVAGAFLARSQDARRSALGLLTGAGLVFLFVAYVQRDGPGTTCWHTATASGCDQHLDPRPWLAVGAAFVLVGVTAHAALRRRRSASGPRPGGD